jgi:hypothetical protein
LNFDNDSFIEIVALNAKTKKRQVDQKAIDFKNQAFSRIKRVPVLSNLSRKKRIQGNFFFTA